MAGECGRGVAVEWLLCGQPMASGDLPFLIELPAATARAEALVA